jgi:hypothetical protein
MTEDDLKAACVVWVSLSNEQQIEFVLRFEKDIRDILVAAGTLDPPVTPPVYDPLDFVDEE